MHQKSRLMQNKIWFRDKSEFLQNLGVAMSKARIQKFRMPKGFFLFFVCIFSTFFVFFFYFFSYMKIFKKNNYKTKQK